MVLNIIGQIKNILKGKKRILIVCPKDSDRDNILSSVALSLFLQKLNKETEIVCENFSASTQLKFIKKINEIKPGFEDLKSCLINIKIEDTGIKNIQYDNNRENLRIFITPKTGILKKENIEVTSSKFKYDLIICLGAYNLESLGSIFKEYADLFYETEILNIDASMQNEEYGDVNFINTKASSLAENIYYILKQTNPELIDQEIATAVLAAIASKTNRFQSSKTKPSSLKIAGELIEYGANLHNIMHNLYQNRKLSTLKLWGEILSNMKNDTEHKLAWVLITREIFAKTGTDETDLEDVFEEFILNSPENKLAVLIYENPKGDNTIQGILRTTKPYNALEFIQNFQTGGDSNKIYFRIENKSLKEAEENIIDFIKKEKTLL